VGGRRAAYYTNLPPRTYRFRVDAAAGDGTWSESTSELTFSVKPLFYQTGWFSALVVIGLAGLVLGGHRWRTGQLRAREEMLARRVEDAVGQVKLLRGMLPICSSCKKIRDDGGYWSQIETYIHEHTEAEFSHSICPDCIQRLYPDYAGGLAAAATPKGNGGG